MFKALIDIKDKLNQPYILHQKIVSPIHRPVSPIRNRPDSDVRKSPIRNRPSDIMFLKNYMDNNLLKKKQTTPSRTRSPLKDQKFRKINSRPSPNQNKYCSPLKTRQANKPANLNIIPDLEEVQRATCRNGYLQSPDLIEHPKKQNLQLFTQLLDEIKSKQQCANQHMKVYSTRTNRDQNKKPELTQFTSMLKNKSNKSKEVQFSSNSKAETNCATEIKPFRQIEENHLLFSLGMQHKEQVSKKQPVANLVPDKIITKKEINLLQSSHESLSANDRVNESKSSDSNMEQFLNMQPGL